MFLSELNNKTKAVLSFSILLFLFTFPVKLSAQSLLKAEPYISAIADTLESIVPQSTAPSLPVSDSNRILREITELGTLLEGRLTRTEDLLVDRVGAVDQRLTGVENRTNETYLSISSFEQQFWYIILALLFLSLVTVLSILILTFKFIEPMKKENKMLNDSFIRLQTEIPKNSDNIHQALKDLAKDDPYIAQILKKNNLL